VHLIVHDVAGLSEVDRVYNLIVAVLLVAVEVWGLTAVA
jgi:hypothetical protein